MARLSEINELVDKAKFVSEQAGRPLGMASTNLGHIVVVLLNGTLTSLRDRLSDEGYQDSADLVCDLVNRCDLYLEKEMHPSAN